MVNRQAHLLN